jgi:putative ECF transporter S component (TIGR02185 family)
MKKISAPRLLIAAVIWVVLYVAASSCGLIHPVCYAYAGTFLPLLFAPVYLLAAANCRSFGAAAALNGFTLIVGLLMGEGNPPFIIGLIVLTGLAELIRYLCGYDTKNGVRRSFIPPAFSFYAYAAHWWTDTEGSLAAAMEEMPAGYADKMVPVIENTPLLAVMLVLTVPAAILGMRLAEKLLKKQAAALK